MKRENGIRQEGLIAYGNHNNYFFYIRAEDGQKRRGTAHAELCVLARCIFSWVSVRWQTAFRTELPWTIWVTTLNYVMFMMWSVDAFIFEHFAGFSTALNVGAISCSDDPHVIFILARCSSAFV